MNQIDSGIMIDENTKLVNVDNTYNDLLILKHDLLKYLKNEKIYFDEELEINIEKEETKRYGNILEVLMSWERIQPNKHLYAFVESSPEGSFTSSIIEELCVSITKKLS